MDAQKKQRILRRYFAGLAEHTFQGELGVVDPPLIDYLTEILIRFVRCDRIFRMRDIAGRPLTQVVEMLREAEARIGEARRSAHQQIGDFTLFWTGVYPERLQHLSRRGAVDHMVDYCAQGKRSYRIASQIDPPDEEETAGDILHRLSDQFELCAYGLRQVRRRWESRDDDSSPGLLLN